MISLKEACKIADRELRKGGYEYGLVGIDDTGDGRWIFTGQMFEDGGTVYGGCPLIMDKQTGKFEWLPLNDMDNVVMYCNSTEVRMPQM